MHGGVDKSRGGRGKVLWCSMRWNGRHRARRFMGEGCGSGACWRGASVGWSGRLCLSGSGGKVLTLQWRLENGE